MKSKIVAMLAVVLAFQAVAQDKKPDAKPSAEAGKEAPAKSDAEIRGDVSYAVGMDFGYRLKRSEYDFDVETITKAMKDVLAGNKTKLSDQEAQAAIQGWQVKQQAVIEGKRKAEGAGNLKKAEAFLAENAKKANIKKHPDAKYADKLQYEVLQEGAGDSPKAADTVKVHYRGTLTDGTEFDSSHKRGEPAEFPLGNVIPGWTQGLQLMKKGAKYKFYIHPEIAYGEKSPPSIPPNSLLIFEVELLDIKKAPEETATAVSGEVIRVPSADELKKGAKIEVLKEEDIKKLTNQTANPKK